MTKDEDDVSLWDVDLICNACGWEGISKNAEILIKKDDKQVLLVCPRCREVDNFEKPNEEES